MSRFQTAALHRLPLDCKQDLGILKLRNTIEANRTLSHSHFNFKFLLVVRLTVDIKMRPHMFKRFETLPPLTCATSITYR